MLRCVAMNARKLTSTTIAGGGEDKKMCSEYCNSFVHANTVKIVSRKNTKAFSPEPDRCITCTHVLTKIYGALYINTYVHVLTKPFSILCRCKAISLLRCCLHISVKLRVL